MTTQAVEKPLFGIAAPAPGMYSGVPFVDYLRWDAASQSRLDTLRTQTPAHLYHQMVNPEDMTRDLVIGRAVHTLVLEPKKFESEFIVSERCSAKKNDGARCSNPGKHRVGGSWLCGVHVKSDRFSLPFSMVDVQLINDRGCTFVKESEHGSRYYTAPDGHLIRVSHHAPAERWIQRMLRDGTESIRVDLPPHGNDDPRTVLTAEESEQVIGMHDSLMRNDLVCSILYGAKVETSGVWMDSETGVLCKYRADIINEKHRIVADLKTTRDGSPQRFPKSIYDFGYHIQAAHYLEGVRAHGIDVAEFVLIVVEKEPPYSVSLFRINDQDIEGRVSAINRGRADRLAMLEIWRACRARNHWPDWGEEIIDIDLPRWA